MQAVLPLLYADLGVAHSGRVYCSDSSLDGMGVVEAAAGPTVAASLTAHDERWRFSDEICRSWGPRQQVLEEMREHRLGDAEGEHLVPDAAVPAVPFEEGSLLGLSWATAQSRPWAYQEHITVLEGRAALWAVNRALDEQEGGSIDTFSWLTT